MNGKFRDILFEEETNQNKEVQERQYQWSSIDEVFEKIKNNFESENENDKIRSKRMNSRKHYMNYIFEDMHKEMKSIWQPYGFLQKSTCPSFTKCVLSCLKIKRNCLQQQPSLDENEKEV